MNEEYSMEFTKEDELLDRIATLEKENAELKNKLEHRNCLDCSNHSSKLRMRTLELEKENAELKGEADSVLDNWCKGNDPCPHLKKRDEQLTKAKDIIKNYMIIVKGGNITVCSVPEENRCINVLKLNVQAEQFLKDSEVNK